MLMPSLATSTTNMALPILSQEFSLSFRSAQWIVLSYLLTVTAMVVGAGRIGDMIGRRRLMLTGIGIFSAASIFCALAPAFGMLIVARLVQGMGAAIMMALTMAFVGDVVPTSRTGRAMGLLGTMSAAGTTLGPALGGMLIAWGGTGMIFLVNVPVGLLTFLLLYRALPAAEGAVAEGGVKGFDTAGMALMIFTLTAYALAMTIGHGEFGFYNIGLMMAAMVGGVLFLVVEAKAASPLIRLGLFRTPAIRSGLAASALVSTVMMTTLIVGPFYLNGALGLGAVMSGLVLSAGPLVAALTGFPAGQLVDRLGPDRVAYIGQSALLAGCCALIGLPVSWGVGGYVAAIMAMTAGYALFQAANNSAIMASANAAERGIVSAMIGLSRNLGLVTGASAMGAVFAFGTSTWDVGTAGQEAVATGMHLAFAVAAVLVMTAILLAFLERHRRN
ncbi:MFS transporter [Sphingobium estronivorans]|uniref:MFS transporter n=1 Tax=Sphingobium estronivorans TaxID=1577690 RepID=UPI0019684A3D|nr:MFS transporter [Sphingobium estronivorans]